ncbi:MAG: hypothetical protein R3C49_15630 [Planctomycetaceae bacterium]
MTERRHWSWQQLRQQVAAEAATSGGLAPEHSPFQSFWKSTDRTSARTQPACLLVSLATGIAVRDVLAELTGGRPVDIKWPNDVLVNDRKICGILTQQSTLSGRIGLIIGVGINVNNSLSTAPDDIRQRATSCMT